MVKNLLYIQNTAHTQNGEKFKTYLNNEILRQVRQIIKKLK